MAISKWEGVKEKLTLVTAWARDGLIEADICHNLGISVQTLNVYKHEHPELVESLKIGKEVADILVINALFKRTQGYKYDEVTKELVIARDKYGEAIIDKAGAVVQELKITKVVTKEVLPDPTSIIFWSKNRMPDQWRDKREVEKTIEVRVPILEEIQDTFKHMRQLNSIEVVSAELVGSE
jgi:hypothetical protein